MSVRLHVLGCAVAPRSGRGAVIIMTRTRLRRARAAHEVGEDFNKHRCVIALSADQSSEPGHRGAPGDQSCARRGGAMHLPLRASSRSCAPEDSVEARGTLSASLARTRRCVSSRILRTRMAYTVRTQEARQRKSGRLDQRTDWPASEG